MPAKAKTYADGLREAEQIVFSIYQKLRNKPKEAGPEWKDYFNGYITALGYVGQCIAQEAENAGSRKARA